jgi:hypothetical protein
MKSLRFLAPVFFSALITGSILISGCEKDENNGSADTQTYTTAGSANGQQQSPPVATTGTATMIGTYNAATNNWQYSINWTSLSSAATIIEIRGPATVGVNGNLVFTLTISAGGTNGAFSNSVTLSEQQEADLLSGKYYYSILTTNHVSGEIRGQIFASPQ